MHSLFEERTLPLPSLTTVVLLLETLVTQELAPMHLVCVMVSVLVVVVVPSPLALVSICVAIWMPLLVGSLRRHS
ncbi:hypothetical protein D9M71_811260 [compost metagenome]